MRCASTTGRRAALALLLVLLAPVPRARADFLRKGPEPFSVRSLSDWAGRSVTRVTFEGLNITRTHVAAREVETRPGQPLDIDTLELDLQRLQNISVFSDIRVTAEADGDGVAIAFVVKESPWVVPFPTFSYTEENGFSVGVALSALNLGGRAVRAGGSVVAGGTTQYRLSLDAPWLWGTNHNSASASIAHRERADTLRGFEETSDELTAGLGRWIGDPGRVNVDFTWLRMRSDVPGITLTSDNQDDLLRLGASIGFDTRDSWRNPRRGWQNEVAFVHTGGFLGGDGDWWSTDVDIRRWIPAGARQKVLLSGLYTMQSGTLGVDVPQYMNYYVGGANSIRGYGVDQLGTPASGKNQLLGTAEYSITLMPVRRWDVLGKFSFAVGAELAVFADAGLAWTEAREFAMNRTHAGLGSGFRLLIPGTEMIRLDVGWSPDGGFQFHFAGNTKPSAQRNRIR